MLCFGKKILKIFKESGSAFLFIQKKKMKFIILDFYFFKITMNLISGMQSVVYIIIMVFIYVQNFKQYTIPYWLQFSEDSIIRWQIILKFI